MSRFPGGFNALHRDLRGSVFFPIQMAVVLSPRVDAKSADGFDGGEFLLRDVPERIALWVTVTLQPRSLMALPTQMAPPAVLARLLSTRTRAAAPERHVGRRAGPAPPDAHAARTRQSGMGGGRRLNLADKEAIRAAQVQWARYAGLVGMVRPLHLE
jgi:hypothetical protein